MGPNHDGLGRDCLIGTMIQILSAKNEDKNDEEYVVTITDEPIEFVIANVDKPSLCINSTVFIPCNIEMFDVHNVLNDRWNQLIVGYFGEAYPLELVQRWEEMSSILSTCSYAKLINREIRFETWDPRRH
ncbi:hypothetical protein KY289_035969 [Solanum tuberosum]|nr:hypothetical protein KY289_035969 [Solanum tuberosum]